MEAGRQVLLLLVCPEIAPNGKCEDRPRASDQIRSTEAISANERTGHKSFAAGNTYQIEYLKMEVLETSLVLIHVHPQSHKFNHTPF